MVQARRVAGGPEREQKRRVLAARNQVHCRYCHYPLEVSKAMTNLSKIGWKMGWKLVATILDWVIFSKTVKKWTFLTVIFISPGEPNVMKTKILVLNPLAWLASILFWCALNLHGETPPVITTQPASLIRTWWEAWSTSMSPPAAPLLWLFNG